MKNECLVALRHFIEESSNENKLELFLVYDAIPDADKESVLGAELNAAIARIVLENDHPDAFLQTLRKF